MGPAEIVERVAYLMVNEAVRCLDEEVVASPRDGDVAAVLGLGFPPFRGGPFHAADAFGADVLARRLETLAARFGPRYEPARGLARGACFFP
jgi:3-hydroxyacyl-CoA dehydrogenase/enoyl-CoA hydratase/3-hydroxybutyryl-CoA epimerase